MDFTGDPEFQPQLVNSFEAGVLFLAMLAGLAACIPRLQPELHPASRHVSINDFDDVTFRHRFRFRRDHVREMLAHFKLLEPDGEPLVLSVGRSGHTSRISSDAAFLTVLSKLSYPASYDDLLQWKQLCPPTYLR